MPGLPSSEYIESREGGGYFVAGTRIGLEVVVCDFRRGKTPEAILRAYPSIGALRKVYGVITFILEHAHAIDSYLHEQDVRWQQLRDEHPISQEMQARYRKTRDELSRRSA